MYQEEVVNVFEIINNPVKEITSFKKANPGRVFSYLILAVVLNTLSIGILTWSSFGSSAAYWVGLFGYLVVGYVLVLFVAYLLKLAVNVLGGNGKYYSGLTSLTLGMVAPAVGFLLFSLLILIPTVGMVLGFLVAATAIALGLSTTLRTIKEMFKVDTLTAIVGLLIAYFALVAASYLLASQFFFGASNLLNMGPTLY